MSVIEIFIKYDCLAIFINKLGISQMENTFFNVIKNTFLYIFAKVMTNQKKVVK